MRKFCQQQTSQLFVTYPKVQLRLVRHQQPLVLNNCRTPKNIYQMNNSYRTSKPSKSLTVGTYSEGKLSVVNDISWMNEKFIKFGTICDFEVDFMIFNLRSRTSQFYSH